MPRALRWAAVAVALLCVGCNAKLSRTGGATPTPYRSVSVGQGLELPDDTVQESSPATTQGQGGGAALRLLISDDQEVHPSGIPVQLSGPRTVTLTSDKDGVVSFSGPPGVYRAKVVEGCHADVLVQKGGSAEIGLVNGTTVEGTLETVWLRRYGPAAPASMDEGGDWPQDKKVTITYSVFDNCHNKRAPNRSFPTYVFDTPSNVDVIGSPVLRSDGDAMARVVARCTAPGSISLRMRDRDNAEQGVDLVTLASDYAGAPRCEA